MIELRTLVPSVQAFALQPACGRLQYRFDRSQGLGNDWSPWVDVALVEEKDGE